MTSDVKDFIEKNIYLIENEDWETFFNKGGVPGGVGAALYEAGIDFMTHLKAVPWRAFMYTDVTNINIPEGVTCIEHGAFYFCQSLTKITLPDSLNSIGVNAFGFCIHLKEVTLPDNVTSIEEEAFSCTGITTIRIPKGVSSISKRAFYQSHLESISFGTHIKTVSIDAFGNCESLKDIMFDGTIEEFKSIKRSREWIDYTVTVHCTDGDIVYRKR